MLFLLFLSFLLHKRASYTCRMILVMSRMLQVKPTPLVQNKSLCLLRKTRKRHSDRNNPIFYFLFSFYYLLLFFVSFTTLKRARSASTFGITIKALKKSDISQTRFTLSVVPMMMQTTTIAEYSFTAPLPKRY